MPASRKKAAPKKTAKKSVKKRAAKPVSKKSSAGASGPAAQYIDQRIRELDDWRGETLAKLRRIITSADPGVVEDWKWAVPVWKHHGLICTGETYKAAVKLTFARGALLKDPSGLFNASLEGATRRAIDVRQDDAIDAGALKALVKEAIALNLSRP
jgi:hypothetical protein